MKENIGEQINSVIDNLANKLGIAADKIYPYLVKQSFAEGIVGIVMFLVFLILFIISIKMSMKYVGVLNDELELDASTFMFILFIIIAFFTFIVSLFSLPDLGFCVIKIINPEYAAIQELIKLIK